MPNDPTFTLPEACVYSLGSPAEFYSLLLAGCSAAERRVTLSSLYFGTGPLEQALLAALRGRLQATPSLQCSLHFDLGRALRRTGPAGLAGQYPSSAALLLELFRGSAGAPCPALASQVSISLAQLPALRGLLGRLAAPRVSEGMGVWHAKAYLFDSHTAVLCGANLSTDYFTTRQDRYVVVSSAQGQGGQAGAAAVAGFVDYLHNTLQQLGSIPGGHWLHPSGSVQVHGRELQLPDQPKAAAAAAPPNTLATISHTPLSLLSPLHSTYARELQRILTAASATAPLAQLQESDSATSTSSSSITLRPRWQLGSLGVRCDELALAALLRSSLRPAPLDTLHLATGYFNLPYPLQAALLHSPAACIHVLTASPRANGFWGAPGVAGAIPLAYCQLLRVFYAAAQRAGVLMQDPEGAPSSPGVAIHEYERSGWTFHAKGLWLHRRQQQQQHAGGSSSSSSSGSSGESLTSLVGSSNYGMRGVHRDLELQVELSTASPAACRRLLAERDALWGRQHVRAVGGHLAQGLGYGRERDVFSALVTPHRALHWRAAWANGAWIYGGFRLLRPFF